MPDGYRVLPVRGLPELRPGDDLAELLAGAVELQDGDVVVVTSKAVSKIEGRLVPVPPGASREEVRLAGVAFETVRVVARSGPSVIAQTRYGLVLAAAGVDASNVRPDKIALLPLDPDASAATLRDRLRNGPRRSSGWTSSWKTPGSSCRRWPATSAGCRGGRCWRP